MKNRLPLLPIIAALLIFIAGPLAQAQPQSQPHPHPLQVGVVVRVEAPDALDPGAIAGRVLHQVERALGDVRAFALVNQELLNQAQERLHIRLGTDSSVRDLRAVAEFLHLDRLIIIYVKTFDRFIAELTAVVFHPRGGQVTLVAFNARGSQLDEVLEHAVGGLLERIFPGLK